MSGPLPPPPAPTPHPHVCFVLFNGLNHDMNHNSEPRHLYHDEPRHLNHDEIASFAGGSRRRECTVLENFAWLPASKTARNCRSQTNACITGNLPGCWLRKKCENRCSRTNSCITGKLENILCNFGQIFHYFKQFRGIFEVGV